MGLRLTQFLLIHTTAEIWEWTAAGRFGDQVSVWTEFVGLTPLLAGWQGYLAAAPFAAMAALSLNRRRTQLAARVQAGLMLGVIAYFFPNVPNHFHAYFLALALAGFWHPERESDDLVWSIKSLAALVFVGAGIQKLLYGTYFKGAFMAMAMRESDGWVRISPWLVSADEFAQLRDPSFSGPYVLESWRGLVISNLSWIAEILLPIGLLWKRLRVPAALAAVLFVLGIQLTARELFFAGFMAPLLLLWASPKWALRLIPISLALDAYLVLAALGGPPPFYPQ